MQQTPVMMIVLYLTVLLGCCGAAVVRYEVELNKTAYLHFGENNYVIKRTTGAHPDAQYIFASPNQDGTWTTNGVNKVGSGSRLFWNGTLVIEFVTPDDLGAYEMPMEVPQPQLARTLVDVVLKNDDSGDA